MKRAYSAWLESTAGLKSFPQDVFFEMFLSVLKDVTKKTSFLRCIFAMYFCRRHNKVVSFEMFLRGLWDASLNGDLIEISQRHLMPEWIVVLIFHHIYINDLDILRWIRVTRINWPTTYILANWSWSLNPVTENITTKFWGTCSTWW